MENLLSKFDRYLYLWLLVVFLFGLSVMTSYVLVQQEGRSSINIPLIQMAQSVEADLKSGASTSAILKAQEIDLSFDQSPFITLYALDKKVIGSSQHFHGTTLTLPDGVLVNARENGEVRLTWQPRRNLRFATVTDYLPNFGYVSTAQSLEETEARATRAKWIGFSAIGLGSVVSGIVMWYLAKRRKGN